MHHPTDRIAHTTAFVIPALAGTRNSSMKAVCVHARMCICVDGYFKGWINGYIYGWLKGWMNN